MYAKRQHMTKNLYGKILKQNWELVVTLVLIASVIALAISVLQTSEYEAKLKVLVIQSQRGQMDPYRAAQSADFLANLLAKVVYSSSFRAHVQESGFGFDKSIFNGQAHNVISVWKKAVSTKAMGDTGILEISAYSHNRNQATELARAVANVFVQNGQEYYGQDSEVAIRILDDALVSDKPVRPSLGRNLFLGALAGFIFGYLIGWLRQTRKQD